VRRNRRTSGAGQNLRNGELAFYRCHSAHPVPPGALVKAAGRRWTVERTARAAEGLAGLDKHQVRGWVFWHRWTTLAMPARLPHRHRRHRTGHDPREPRSRLADLQ